MMATGAAAIVQPVGDLQSKFHPALLDLLKTLRLAGGKPDVVGIYRVYNHSVMQTLEVDDFFGESQLITFLSGLAEMRPDCIYLENRQHPPEVFNLDVHYAHYVKNSLPADGLEEMADLLTCVYWFQKEGAVPAEKRVYIHLAPPLAESGIAVLKVLVPKLRTVPGFQKVKMFGPLEGLGRNDSIVVYCSDRESQKEIANSARALKPHLFQADLPRLVKPVCPGVGVADEPPGVPVFQGDDDKQSFGKFLSKLIWLAWNHNELGTDEEFLRLMLIALRVARIDPMKPHKHSRRAEVEAMQPGLAQVLEAELSKTQ
jgi:hypothetical protein